MVYRQHGKRAYEYQRVPVYAFPFAGPPGGHGIRFSRYAGNIVSLYHMKQEQHSMVIVVNRHPRIIVAVDTMMRHTWFMA